MVTTFLIQGSVSTRLVCGAIFNIISLRVYFWVCWAGERIFIICQYLVKLQATLGCPVFLNHGYKPIYRHPRRDFICWLSWEEW